MQWLLTFLLCYADPNEFLTTSDYATIVGAAYKTGNNAITRRGSAMGSVITFPINASVDTTADLYFNLANRQN